MREINQRVRYWATMVTARRATGGHPQVREIGPAASDEELDVLVAQEWRRAEAAGFLVCDVRERTEG